MNKWQCQGRRSEGKGPGVGTPGPVMKEAKELGLARKTIRIVPYRNLANP